MAKQEEFDACVIGTGAGGGVMYPGGCHPLGGYSPAQMMGKEKSKTVWGEEV